MGPKKDANVAKHKGVDPARKAEYARRRGLFDALQASQKALEAAENRKRKQPEEAGVNDTLKKAEGMVKKLRAELDKLPDLSEDEGENDDMGDEARDEVDEDHGDVEVIDDNDPTVKAIAALQRQQQEFMEAQQLAMLKILEKRDPQKGTDDNTDPGETEETAEPAIDKEKSLIRLISIRPLG